jgi:hypothetical protein
LTLARRLWYKASNDRFEIEFSNGKFVEQLLMVVAFCGADWASVVSDGLSSRSIEEFMLLAPPE